jgi:hypothetical protein
MARAVDSFAPKVDRQSETNNLSLPLPLIDVDVDLVARQPSFTRALTLTKDLAGLQNDKQAYAQLGIDAAQWSKIMSGQGHFPHDKLVKYMLEVCGNVAPLVWLIHRCGFDPRSLKRYQTAVEAELAETKERLAEKERELETIKAFMRSTR